MHAKRRRPLRSRNGATDWTTVLLIALGGAIVIWVLSGDWGEAESANDRPATGSANPCHEPVAWRLTEVDQRFGIPRDRVLDAIHSAVRLWEESAGRRLFVHDKESGMPIRLVFDERQVETLDRISRLDRLRDLEQELRREQARFDAVHREFSDLRVAYERRAARLDAQIEEHNRKIREWEIRGGIPDRERARLAEETGAIRRESHELERMAWRLDELGPRLERESRRMEVLVDRFNHEARASRDHMPGRQIRSAVFEKATLGRGLWRNETGHRITIFQFTDEQHLIMLLAHELGHALGLGHVDDPLAVMREEYALEQLRAPLRLHTADLAALSGRCGAEWGG